MKKQFLALLCIFAMNGIAVADDVQTRLKAMEAERDSASKHNGSSETYFSDNCPKHLVFWQQAAQQGQAIAQSLLASCHFYGKGIDKDKAQAMVWFRKAAEQGIARAQANLGLMYAKGEGIAKDEAQAVEWFRKAAEQGDAKAQVNLGNM